MTALPAPHGGTLCELLLPQTAAEAVKIESRDFPSWDLTEPQLDDLELLITGAYSPLVGFMGENDYHAVLRDMRLANGTLWPLPVTLDVSAAFAAALKPGSRIGLRDPEGLLVAVMDVESIWTPDRRAEAEAVFGTTDATHPGLRRLLERSKPVCIGGAVRGLELPMHYDFRHLRRTPREVREHFSRQGWRRIVAFHSTSPMHRAEVELTVQAAHGVQGNLLLHPVAGRAAPGDADHYARVRSYEHAVRHYPEGSALLSLVPLRERWAGPREVLLQAIVRKNHGCTHFIVARGQACALRPDGTGFNPAEATAELARRHEAELGIAILYPEPLLYVEDRAQYVPASGIRPGERTLSLSAAEFRRRMLEGIDIPKWYSYPDVIEELRRYWPPRIRQGVTVFFTGLSGSGKSTIANALLSRLMELGNRTVTLLDGDIVRKNLSSELGFSREHRDLNILRIGFVASEITKHGGIAICAPIAPYAITRRKVREMIEAAGGFIEVHVATPLEVCESRDRKGLYAKARAGLIKEFTGISDPYEAPENPELRINTAECTPLEAAQIVLNRLEADGYIR